MQLRNRLRSETSDLHESLENTYPFKKLLEADNIQQTLDHSLLCFKFCFYPFLYQVKSKHAFFNQVFNVFQSHHPDVNEKLLNIEMTETDKMAIEYLFLGSRMGNRLAIKKNPAILETNLGEYFALDLPKELWDNFLIRCEQFTDEDQQNEIIEKTREAFTRLTQLGLSLKATL